MRRKVWTFAPYSRVPHKRGGIYLHPLINFLITKIQKNHFHQKNIFDINNCYSSIVARVFYVVKDGKEVAVSVEV